MNFIDNFSSFGFNINPELIQNTQTFDKSNTLYNSDPGFDNVSEYGFSGQSRNASAQSKGLNNNYKNIKPILKYYSNESRIQEVVETICDEVINFDKNNRFCTLDIAETDLKKEIIDIANNKFKTIYSLFGFNSRIVPWNLFKEWLDLGEIAFEIIYNNAQTEIIGFRKIPDPENLEFIGKAKKSDKNLIKDVLYWKYQSSMSGKIKYIPDNHIVYISYNSVEQQKRYSYIQRLIKPYNILNSMEISQVIFNFTNSTYNKVITVPTSGKSRIQARQTLVDVSNLYKDDIKFNNSTGEISVNGNTRRHFFKEYYFQEKDGERPRVETIQNTGPDLNNMELDYYINAFYEASKVPKSRFVEGGGSFSLGDPTNQERKEIRFTMFLNRLKSIFSAILIKPLYIQLTLLYPELEGDINFKNNLQINFVKNNYFEELKEFEVRRRRVDHINMLRGITRDDDDRAPFFSTELLLKKFLGMDEEFIDENKAEMDKHIKD